MQVLALGPVVEHAVSGHGGHAKPAGPLAKGLFGRPLLGEQMAGIDGVKPVTERFEQTGQQLGVRAER